MTYTVSKLNWPPISSAIIIDETAPCMVEHGFKRPKIGALERLNPPAHPSPIQPIFMNPLTTAALSDLLGTAYYMEQMVLNILASCIAKNTVQRISSLSTAGRYSRRLTRMVMI